MRYEWPWGTSLLVAKAVKLDKPVFYATEILHLFDLWRIKVEEKLSSWTLFKDSLIFWHWSHMIHCHYCKKSYPCSDECISSLSQLARAGDLQCRHGYTWSVHIRPHHDELHLPGRRQLKGIIFTSRCCSQASGWYKASHDQKKPPTTTKTNITCSVLTWRSREFCSIGESPRHAEGIQTLLTACFMCFTVSLFPEGTHTPYSPLWM